VTKDKRKAHYQLNEWKAEVCGELGGIGNVRRFVPVRFGKFAYKIGQHSPENSDGVQFFLNPGDV
jgi:hypothetical protein